MEAEKAPKVIYTSALNQPNLYEEAERKKEEQLKELKAKIGQENITKLVESGLSEDELISYLLEGKTGHSDVIGAVKNFIQAKALLEFHGIQDADLIAATLVAPITAPSFPTNIGVHDY